MTDNDADPYGEWLNAFIDRTAPQPVVTRWTWARIGLGLAVMSAGMGASACAFPGAAGLLTAWAAASAVGIDIAHQTLDQSEG